MTGVTREVNGDSYGCEKKETESHCEKEKASLK